MGWYAEQFSLLGDLHIHEIIKLEMLLPKVRTLIDYDVSTFELEVKTRDFVGYIDLIVKNSDGTVDIFDFKYLNNVGRYLESEQLHIYKHYLEKVHRLKVRRLGYIFIPKTSIRQKKTEDLYQFRRRLRETLRELKVTVAEVGYDPHKVERFFPGYPKHQSGCRLSEEPHKTVRLVRLPGILHERN
jgi:hypothetical protein